MKKAVIIEVSFYVLAVGLVCLLWPMPIVLALCLVGISLLVLWRWHTRSDLIIYGVGFVLGPAAEVVAVHFGAWEYAKPLLLLPLWLPPVWGITAVLMRRLTQTLVGEP